MKQLFHIKIQDNNIKVDVIFNYVSCVNLIATDLVSNIGLEVHDHPSPYPLGWVNKDAKIKVLKQCKINFDVMMKWI
jgi:hypothetical protein